MMEDWSIRLMNWYSFHSIVNSMPVYCGEEEAELRGEALCLPNSVGSYPQK